MKNWLQKMSFGILSLLIIGLGVVLGNANIAQVNATGNCATTNTCNLADASDFAQYCSANTTTCSKVDQTGTSGSASCPDETQTIDAVYVHAGGGQTVVELPDNANYTETFSNNNATVTVTVNGTGPTHPNLSWVAVVCSAPIPTIDPCQTNPSSCITPTATPSATPTATPSATPTVTITVTPTTTPTPTTDPCANNACTTPTPTSTPSGCTSNCGSNTNNNSGGSSSQPIQAVLGTSTMASTGTFTQNMMNGIFTFGMMVLALGAMSYAKEKRN